MLQARQTISYEMDVPTFIVCMTTRFGLFAALARVLTYANDWIMAALT